jgi:DNA-binding transcriptional LysR family regulator
LTTEVCALLAKHPGLRVELHLTDARVNLVEEGFDVLFTVGSAEDQRLVVRPIMPYRMMICASPEYLRGKPAVTLPRDLAQHVCLGFTYWARRDEWRLDGSEGSERIRVNGNFSANSGEALRRAALAGAGVIMQPELLLDVDVREGRLTQLLADALPAPRTVQMIFAASRRQNVRIFTSFIRERFGAA